jgi:hypothetical protein
MERPRRLLRDPARRRREVGGAGGGRHVDALADRGDPRGG